MPIFTVQERKDLVLKFESRRVSCEAFCKTHNISAPTIYKWRREFEDFGKTIPSVDSDDSFIPIEVSRSDSIDQVSTPEEPSSITSSFKIYASSLTIEFCSGCRISELGAVIGVFGGKNASK